MISCCHAAVSPSCGIVAAPRFTSSTWPSLSLSVTSLPLVPQLPPLSDYVSLGSPHLDSGSQAHQATKKCHCKFTGSLLISLLSASKTLSVSLPVLARLDYQSHTTLFISTESPETQSESSLRFYSLLNPHIQADCRQQPWRSSLQKTCSFHQHLLQKI